MAMILHKDGLAADMSSLERAIDSHRVIEVLLGRVRGVVVFLGVGPDMVTTRRQRCLCWHAKRKEAETPQK